MLLFSLCLQTTYYSALLKAFCVAMSDLDICPLKYHLGCVVVVEVPGMQQIGLLKETNLTTKEAKKETPQCTFKKTCRLHSLVAWLVCHTDAA